MHVLQNPFHGFAVVHLAALRITLVSVDQQQELLLNRLSALLSVAGVAGTLLRLLAALHGVPTSTGHALHRGSTSADHADLLLLTLLQHLLLLWGLVPAVRLLLARRLHHLLVHRDVPKQLRLRLLLLLLPHHVLLLLLLLLHLTLLRVHTTAAQ